MGDRNTIAICLTVFATVSSVAWAIAAANIYGPVKTAKEICANASDATRASVFCVELVRK